MYENLRVLETFHFNTNYFNKLNMKQGRMQIMSLRILFIKKINKFPAKCFYRGAMQTYSDARPTASEAG